MDYYDIISLIVFWKKQKKEGFKAIMEVIDIIDDEEIPSENKGLMIIRKLNEYELYEVDYHKNNEDLGFIDVPEEVTFHHEGLIAPMDYFEIRLLNTALRTLININ
jgi:hypothetical protein